MSISAINSPNQFRGRITHIERGPVVSEVEVNVDGGIVTSVITTSSLNSLGLEVGADVLAVVKSSEVALARLYNNDATAGYSPYLD
jgi:molybdopterin-binding protein